MTELLFPSVAFGLRPDRFRPVCILSDQVAPLSCCEHLSRRPPIRPQRRVDTPQKSDGAAASRAPGPQAPMKPASESGPYVVPFGAAFDHAEPVTVRPCSLRTCPYRLSPSIRLRCPPSLTRRCASGKGPGPAGPPRWTSSRSSTRASSGKRAGQATRKPAASASTAARLRVPCSAATKWSPMRRQKASMLRASTSSASEQIAPNRCRR